MREDRGAPYIAGHDWLDEDAGPVVRLKVRHIEIQPGRLKLTVPRLPHDPDDAQPDLVVR